MAASVHRPGNPKIRETHSSVEYDVSRGILHCELARLAQSTISSDGDRSKVSMSKGLNLYSARAGLQVVPALDKLSRNWRASRKNLEQK